MSDSAIMGGPSPYLDRPRVLAFGGIVLGSLAAWIALSVMSGTVPGQGLTGRGMDWLTAICGGIGLPFAAALPGAVAMWVLMSIAMMLPTAAPAIDIYVRLTRKIEARRTAHIAGFTGGYLIAWSALAVTAGAAQAAVGSGLAARAALVPAGYLTGGILLLAGLYQLTPLKQACLTLCRNPMAFFMSHWREDIGGALRMGLHHGAICIGCCWALMGLMFLSGAMNLAWMAGLGLLMLLEKAAPGAGRAGQLAGLAMALAGTALIVTEIV